MTKKCNYFQEGESMRESLKEMKELMKAGSMVKYDCHVLGRADFFGIQRERDDKILQEQTEVKYKIMKPIKIWLSKQKKSGI